MEATTSYPHPSCQPHAGEPARAGLVPIQSFTLRVAPGLTIFSAHLTTFFPVQGLSATSLTVAWGAGTLGS